MRRTSLSISTFGYFGRGGARPTPGRVINLTATPRTTRSILLTWKFSTSTDYYNVERADSSTGRFYQIKEVCSDVYYIDSVTSSQYYWYRVRPVNASYYGSYSNTAVRAAVKIGNMDLNGLIKLVSLQDKLNRGLSLFFNDRLWQFTKHIAALMVNHVMKQQVYYYEMDESTMSGRNKIYGERRRKIWKRPKKLYGRILRKPVDSDRRNYGHQNMHSILIYFDKNHLDREKVDVNFMIGNQIEWDHKSFLVRDVKYFDSVKGLSDYKMTVVVSAVYTQD